MEKLRSHIIRWISLVFITLGLALCLIRPVETQHSQDSFTRWIQSLQSNSELSPELRSQLQQLQHFEGDFQTLVQRASLLINQYNKQFALPFAVDMDGDPIEHLPKQLLAEWNFYYQLGELVDGLPTPSLKPVASLLGSPLGIIGPSNKHTDLTAFQYTVGGWLQYTIATSIIPMVNGIAIGAP